MKNIKSAVQSLITPSVDTIVGQFVKTHNALLKRASLHAERGEALKAQADAIRAKAAQEFMEQERAERIAENFRVFVGK